MVSVEPDYDGPQSIDTSMERMLAEASYGRWQVVRPYVASIIVRCVLW
jgi:hypothetical protein